MLTRLYVDNYKCFVNFEMAFDRAILLIGTNGVGKSVVLDIIRLLRDFVGGDLTTTEAFATDTLTFWQLRDEQVFELEAELPAGRFTYRLVIAHDRGRSTCGVKEETLTCDGQRLVVQTEMEVERLDSTGMSRLELQRPNRSLFSTVGYDLALPPAARAFAAWLAQAVVLRLNPFAMQPISEREEARLAADGSNFASWYRDWVQQDFQAVSDFHNGVSRAVTGFQQFKVDGSGRLRSLLAEFVGPDGKRFSCFVDQLSEGQKALLVLYAVQQAALAKPGCLLMLDEPDNFVALEEVELCLRALRDAADDGLCQLLVVSHHPQTINQMAPSNGLVLKREGLGPTRARRFRYDGGEPLTASELVARGWLEDE